MVSGSSFTGEILRLRGISHRDIKPSNIYFYEGRFYLGDFGLVDFPDNTSGFTKENKGLGAIFTIAPEMKRNPKNADGEKADVFSFAKTMWMFLTGNEKGFDGVYNYSDPNCGLSYVEKYHETHLVELEELFQDATSNNPNNRPSVNSALAAALARRFSHGITDFQPHRHGAEPQRPEGLLRPPGR